MRMVNAQISRIVVEETAAPAPILLLCVYKALLMAFPTAYIGN